MAKSMTVPESSSPESPTYWRKMFDASDKRRDRVNTQFVRYSRWMAGDLRDVVDPKVTEDYLRWQSGLENMTHLATVASLADLLFRWPQFVVNTPYVAPPPVPMMDDMGMPLQPPPLPTLFNPVFARCQTTKLARGLRRANYLVKARRALQDTLLGGMGVLKIVPEMELVVDEEVLEAAKLEAQNELVAFLSDGVKMEAKDEQIHAVHIEIKRQALALMEQGKIRVPKAAIKYMRQHIAFHEMMKGSERPTETVRTSQVRIRRINPMDFFFDPTVDDLDDATWVGSRYLMRRQDLLANEKFDKQARVEAVLTQDRWESRTHRPSVLSPGSFDVSEDMVMVNEVFDLVMQKRRVFADGGSLCLIPDEDRGELSVLQPSGPFNVLIFVQDVMEAHGVAPPSAFESEQSAATAIASANVRAAIQSVPKTMFNSRDISPADAKRIWEAGTAEFIPVAPLGDPKKPLEDCFAQVPPAKIEQQNLEVLANCIRGIERRSGLGVAKMGGGEQAPTATGAALGAEASMSISEDRGALTDAWQERTGRTWVRLDRRFAPKSQWIEECGDEAIEAVPDRITLIEAADDIAVEIVPGSSRRRNTSVDQKQVLDLVEAIAPMPMFQGPEGSKVVLQIIRRFADDAGMTGINWTPMEQEAQAMAAMQQMAMQGAPGAAQTPGGPMTPPGPGGAPGGPPGASQHPPSESAGVADNDIQQGVSNVGGGRVKTGASIGDKISAQRSGAKSAVMNRG